MNSGQISVLLDAGPLQTLFLLHYLEQTQQIGTERGRALIREQRSKMAEFGNQPRLVLSEMLAGYRRRCYTQSGLAEALRFRKPSILKAETHNIRYFAVDAIASQDLVEIHPSPDYLTNSARLISVVGITDAIYIHLLARDADLVMLTDDGRLRHHAGVMADRLAVFDELLDFRIGLR